METHTFFLYLLIILLAARILAELAVRLKAPSVIGELMAGVVLGPSLFGWLEPGQAIKLMAEIGIILLLFEVGLATDLKRLARTGAKSIRVATLGFVLPIAGFLAELLDFRTFVAGVFIYWRHIDGDQYWHHRAGACRFKTSTITRGADCSGCCGAGRCYGCGIAGAAV